jgi:hypothetical protein
MGCKTRCLQVFPTCGICARQSAPLKPNMLDPPAYVSRAHARRALSAALLSLPLLLVAPDLTQAQESGVVAAASAFARAQQAELAGEHARAAELFELADRIAPTPEALRSATRARLSAGQLESAAGNAEELLRRYEEDPASRELAEDVLSEAQPKLTRVAVECSEPCSVVVDGLASTLAPLPSVVVYVKPGEHKLTVAFVSGGERAVELRGGASEERVVRVTAPARAPAAPSSTEPAPAVAAPAAQSEPRELNETRRDMPRKGLSQTYFWSAAGLTVVTGAVALWSGLDLLKARHDFEQREMPSRAEFDRGEQKDTRTTVLLVVTGAFAVSTAVLAPFTRFARLRGSATVASDGHGALLGYRGRF